MKQSDIFGADNETSDGVPTMQNDGVLIGICSVRILFMPTNTDVILSSSKKGCIGIRGLDLWS